MESGPQRQAHRLHIDGRRAVSRVERIAVEKPEPAVVEVLPRVGYVIRHVVRDKPGWQPPGWAGREVRNVRHQGRRRQREADHPKPQCSPCAPRMGRGAPFGLSVWSIGYLLRNLSMGGNSPFFLSDSSASGYIIVPGSW